MDYMARHTVDSLVFDKRELCRIRTCNSLLPSINEVCEGHVFTHVCHSVQGGSRLIPRGEVEGSAQGAGVQGPYPGGLGLSGRWAGRSPDPGPGGLQAQAWGGPGPGGTGVYPSMH